MEKAEQAIIITLIDSIAKTQEEFDTMLRQWLDSEKMICVWYGLDGSPHTDLVGAAAWHKFKEMLKKGEIT